MIVCIFKKQNDFQVKTLCNICLKKKSKYFIGGCMRNKIFAEMKSTNIVKLFFLYAVTSLGSNSVHFIDATLEEDHPLCVEGCKCPQNGQTMMLLNCSRLGLLALPTSLKLDPSFSKLTFQNNLLTSVRMWTFSKVDNIEELDFSFNQITNIDAFTFAPFGSLTMLRLSNNQLSKIESGLLEGLENLRALELGFNEIHKLASDAFKGTPNLQELRLNHNLLFDLDEQLFQYLPNLERLDLTETALVQLPSEIFLPTPHLKWLSLSFNSFEKIPRRALSQARMLRSLDLSGNDIDRLEPGDFRTLSNVTTLHLNNLWRLTRIEKDALAGLKSLKTLSCSFNKNLVYIDGEAFGGENSTISRKETLPHEQLYLQRNGLRTLKSPLNLAAWASLNFIDLADNPWKCDCNLLWMRDLKPETQMNIRCDSPPRLRGRPINLLKVTDLRCQDTWTFTILLLALSAIAAFGLIILAVSVTVCSRTRIGLFIRAQKQFSYAKVVPKAETADLEWDHSAEL